MHTLVVLHVNKLALHIADLHQLYQLKETMKPSGVIEKNEYYIWSIINKIPN